MVSKKQPAAKIAKTPSKSQTSVPAKLPKSPETAEQLGKQLGALVKQSSTWETTVYKASNDQLYSILAQSLQIHNAIASGKKSVEMDAEFHAHTKEKGIKFKKSTPLTGRVARVVFDGVSRQRLSVYQSVLDTAVEQKVSPEKLGAYIQKEGGIESIRLSQTAGKTSDDKTQAAADHINQSRILTNIKDSALSEELSHSGAGDDWILICKKKPNGSLDVKGAVYQQAAIDAALKAYYSLNKDEIESKK